jgi:antitoxin component YwqK of YwqJK toxin-antitoxin module
MKKLLVAMFVALLMVGCGGDGDIAIPKMIKCDGCQKAVYSSADDCPNCGHPVEDSVGVYVEEREEIIKQAYDFIGLTEEEARNEANQGGGKEREEIIKRGNEILRLTVDLDDKETRNRIIAEAIDVKKLQNRSEKGEVLLYAPNEQTPHTGWLKAIYGNGQIKVLGQLKDGKPSRLTQWYENGQKGSEEINKAGKNVTARWYENGNKAERFTVINGQKHGPWTTWYENGLKKAEVNWENGEMHGLMTFWYDNGQKKEEGIFKNSLKDGPRTEWYRNGQKRYEAYYKGGRLVSAVVWKPNGEKCPVTYVEDGAGVVVNYNENGTVKNGLDFEFGEGTLQNESQTLLRELDIARVAGGYKHGKETTYYENGGKQSEKNYKDDKQDGLWTSWYENGQKKDEITWKASKIMTIVAWKPNGEKCSHTNVVNGNGVLVGYYENGQKDSEGNYKGGKLMTVVVWKPNGDKCPVTNIKDGNGVVGRYYENGQKRSEINYKDGKWDGLRTWWDENGTEIYRITYKDGKQDGLSIYYNEDGTERGRSTYKDGKLVRD